MAVMLLSRASLDLPLAATAVDGSFSAGAALNVLMLGLGCLTPLLKHRPSLVAPTLIWAPYIAIAAFSLTYAPHVVSGLRLLLTLASYGACFFICYSLSFSRESVTLFLKAAIFSSVIPIIAGAAEYAVEHSRVNSTFTHPNIFAFYIIFVISAILYFRFERLASESRFWSLFPLLLLPPLGVELILTETRSAWASAALIAVVYAVAVNRKFLIVLVAAAPALIFAPAISERLSDLDTTVDVEEAKRGSEQLNSYAWRKALWEYALADSVNARTTGKGLGSFRYYSPYFFPLEETADAHSGYVQAIYETGLPGFVAYLWLYVGAAFFLWRSGGTRGDVFLIGAFIAANLMFNYSDNVPYYLAYNWYAFALMGAALSWSKASREEARATDDLSYASILNAPLQSH